MPDADYISLCLGDRSGGKKWPRDRRPFIPGKAYQHFRAGWRDRAAFTAHAKGDSVEMKATTLTIVLIAALAACDQASGVTSQHSRSHSTTLAQRRHSVQS